VIFFIPAAELDNQSAASVLLKTREFIQICNRHNRSCSIALTKIDCVVPNLRDNNTTNYANHDTVKKFCQRAADVSSIPRIATCY
jgi:hypothetical protein